MNKLYLDPKTKALLEVDPIGSHLSLKGINFKGSFRAPIEYKEKLGLEPAPEDPKKLDKLKYKGGWPLRLAEILLSNSHIKKKSSGDNILTLNFDSPKKPKKKIKEVKEKPKKVTKVIKEVPKTASKEITLAQLCDQLGIKPAAARGKLRGKVDKPTEGWKWNNPKEIEKIKKLLGGK